MVPVIGIWWRHRFIRAANAKVEPHIAAMQALTDKSFPRPPQRLKIDFSQAGIPELMAVPGIAAGTIKKLVKARQSFERPPTLADLRMIDGISARQWELFEEYFTFPPGPIGPMPKLNLNKAGAEHLEALPGVGETLAAEIIATRTRLGGFRQLDDLQEVPGLTEAGFNKFADLVTLE